MLCYKKAVSSFSISHFCSAGLNMRARGEKKPIRNLSGKKSPSLNSCSVTAALEISFSHQALRCSSEAVGGMERHHRGDMRAGVARDALFAQVRWGRHWRQSRAAQSAACAHPTTPPAAPDARTSPAHPHQEICSAYPSLQMSSGCK